MSSNEFSDFVASRGKALWRSAWLLTGDSSAAEDLVQTALIKSWPHFGRVSRNGSFEAYVKRAMYTTFLSWRTRHWVREVPGELPDQVGQVEDVDLSLDLKRAMSGLTPRQRAVITLRYFDDLTERETAELLHCSIGSVKTHHHRALATLRAAGLLKFETTPQETP